MTTRNRAVVLFDGDCPLCRRGVAVLKRLDWFGTLAYQNCRDTAHLPACDPPLNPDRLVVEMHVVTPDRRHAPAGFEAFRWLAWRLPLTLPVAPLLSLPGVPAVGTRVYRWVAKNRFDLVPCEGGVCRLPVARMGSTSRRKDTA